ncbi:glycosyltransferase [Dyadobacter crusticola]|uniref:glycosyltransferase n=1 Tax=Dyadobacter crusticola TaxID=292407 RepID=UPI00068A987B|nr:glycosyltransferase family A protein [Dyadobacter crusticola]
MFYSSKKVSIIIPTFHDWDRLAVCLSALSKQTLSRDQFEIIVANNDPTDKTPAGFIFPSNCSIIEVAAPGSYAARNAAISVSNGEIIGFTDSDCIPEVDWIANACNFFAGNPQISRIAGHIDLFFQGDRLLPAEVYEKVYAFKQDLVVERLNSSVTGNMFSYKKVFDDVGQFNESLFSGGDHEWARRAQAKGFNVAYSPEVRVKHPARHKMSELVKKSRRVGGGRAGMRRSSRLKASAKVLWALIPRLNEIYYYLNRYGNDLPSKQKVQVIAIKTYLDFVERLEEFKFAFGKTAERG